MKMPLMPFDRLRVSGIRKYIITTLMVRLNPCMVSLSNHEDLIPPFDRLRVSGH